MIRIAFIGAGAVGGYFGGLMSSYYQDSKELEIYFICKDSTSRTINAKGLKMDTTHGSYWIHPRLFSTGTNDSISFDYIFCCTKSFDLESSILSLKKCISQHTVIIPLLNGVDGYDRIKSVLPNTEVWEACVYIVSRLVEPGHVQETGGIQLLYFGSRDNDSKQIKDLEQLLKDAGINAIYSENIRSTIWEKFLFISSIASLTCYLDKSIGEILNHHEYKMMFDCLLSELNSIARAKSIPLQDGILNSIYDKMNKLPYEATSSMHRDYLDERKTELETLTGIVVRMADELDLNVPLYNKIYLTLKEKSEQLIN